jgi:hypothetical protein
MIEIFQIFTFIIIFSIILFAPINIFNKKTYIKDLSIMERSSLNLAINLNILLLISFLNYPLQTLQPFILIFYSSIIFFHYRNKLVLLKEFILFLLPFFIIFFILSVNISSNLYLSWDAKYFYYIKSLFFFDGKTIFDLNQFSQNIWHPYFGSYLWGFFWSISFTEVEYYGRLFYLFLFCYSFYFISQIDKNSKINNSIFLILVLIFYRYEFFSGLQEIIIFSFLVLISKFFDRILISKNIIYLILIILFSNLFIWIKSEGIVYFLLSLAMILLINRISCKLKISIFFIFIILLLTKVYIFDMANFNLNSQGMFYNLDYLSELSLNILVNKIIIISLWLSYYMLTNIFFPIFVLLIIFENFFLKKQKKYLEYDKILYFYFCCILLYIFAAYILRDMEIIQSIRTTMDRIVMTASGFLIYPCIKKLISNLKIKKNYK